MGDLSNGGLDSFEDIEVIFAQRRDIASNSVATATHQGELKISPPSEPRKQPDIFCLSFAIRISRSP